MKLSEASILFVDDEPGIRDIFEKWLTHAGCASLTTCSDGEEALAALTTSHFDLLISDIRMPKIDGVTLVRRRYEVGSRVPCVLFISGFGDIVPREMYALGVEAFLPKPTRREEFFRIIGRSLAERSELWCTPSLPPPRQLIAHQGVGKGKLAPLTPSSFPSRVPSCASLPAIGRGGFSLFYPRPLALGKVGFHLSCGPDHPHLKGEGTLRWRSREEGLVGIEFEWLDPTCRDAVLSHIATTHPVSYIPDSISTQPPQFDKPLPQNEESEHPACVEASYP